MGSTGSSSSSSGGSRRQPASQQSSSKAKLSSSSPPGTGAGSGGSAIGAEAQRIPKGVASQRVTGGGEISIREIAREDAESAASLIARLKRLNGEFDPLLKTTDNLEEDALETVRKAMSSDDSVLMIAAVGQKVVGVVKADLVDRIYYEPRMEGAIVEFYILPEYRRGSLGKDLLSSVSEALKKKGAELITAEFPSQNEIAKRFYTKLGFRSVTNVYARADL